MNFMLIFGIKNVFCLAAESHNLIHLLNSIFISSQFFMNFMLKFRKKNAFWVISLAAAEALSGHFFFDIKMYFNNLIYLYKNNNDF